MVESRNITFFMVVMTSPYIGKRTVINGHAIYNALLHTNKFNPKDIKKVSFGISQNFPISYKGKNDFYINIEEPEKKKTLIKNIEKGYDGFIALRTLQNNLTNPLIDYSPIPFTIISPKHNKEITHQIQVFNFFIIWNNNIPEIEFMGLEFGLGKARNNGFGFVKIHDYVHTETSKIVNVSVDEPMAFTGIDGIYNHTKYGFGEYIITETNNKIPIIKLTTPLCLSSTIPKSTQYGSLPTFVKDTEYTKIPYYLWYKNQEHKLDCINSGKVMEVCLNGIE